MKRPALFFDRDNTLLISDGYLADPAAVTLVEGAADAVARARQLGFATVIFSNQSGVGRGYFDESVVEAVNRRLDALLREKNAGAIIDRHEFCPYHPEATVERYRVDSPLRKPNPGMIYEAANALALDLERSWVIGDAPRDVAAGQAAGCRTILFTDPTLPSSVAATEELAQEPDARVGTLKGAIDFIEKVIHGAAEATGDGMASEATYASQNESPAVSSDSILPPAMNSAENAPIVTSGSVSSDNSASAAPLKEEPPESEQPPTAAEITGASAPAPPITMAMDVDALAAAFARETASLIQRIPSKTSAPPAMPALGAAPSTVKLEQLLEQFLTEFKRSRTPQPHDFSVSKLLAGIVQILALAALVSVYFLHPAYNGETALMLAVALQTLTIALLIMGKQG